MKKVLCISLVSVMILGGVPVAFAAGSSTANTSSAIASTTSAAATVTSPAVTTTGSSVTASPAAVIVPDMTFTGTPIQLSLEGAYKKMLADSPGAKMAELNKQSADGVAQGYSESVQDLRSAERSGGDYDATSKALAQLSREFASTQSSRNYEAEINKLKNDMFNSYYSLKEFENQLKIAKDNLALKEKLLSNTQLKYKLGTVAKNDVLKAEISLNEAKDQSVEASNGFYAKKMLFNHSLGYDIMQNTALTDTIKEIPLPQKTLKDSIQSALKNRNEIAEASYNLQVAKLASKKYLAYPSNSAKYVDAQLNILKAETAVKNAPAQIEMDVRNKYMEMNQKYAAVQTGKKSVENAKETARLAQLQYDTGMATLSDVDNAQLGYYNAQLNYSKALLGYNLAVNAYNLCSGVGIDAAGIK